MVITAMFGISATYADGDGSQMRVKAEKGEIKTDMMEIKAGAKADVKKNRMQAKENRSEFRTEYKDELEELKASLSDDQKSQLEELKAAYKSEVEEIRENMKSAESDEERSELAWELAELRDQQFEDISEILWDEAAEMLEARKAIFEENKALRSESKEVRMNAREERAEYIDTYKWAFLERIWNRLDGASADSLEKISERIDMILEKTENNTSMSEEKKQARIDAIMALKEIIEEQLEAAEEDQDALEVVSELISE